MLPLFLLLLPAAEHPSPEQSVKLMTLPKGFSVQLVAGEPTLIKPIAMTTDEKGRLWVVENHSYPKWIKDGKPGKDRVLILTPSPDGKHDLKVFLDNGSNLSGIAVGFGGVWLCASPNLLFVPMKDDKPAGKPQVLLDGWALDARHNVFNSLTWGPDGWLYGCNGILSTSWLGKPGTPKKDRVPINCGVWRYHPTRHAVEAFAWGTTNPWGLDFDQHGEMFITNCVIKHVFHVVPGAHFVRMFGQDLNPHTYGLLESTAEHIHWAGGSWTSSRGGKGAHSAAGGGHAHAGALVYQGGTWPKEYHNTLLMCNIHGNRLNRDLLEWKRSCYVAKRAPDFLFANDEWFRGLVLTAAPDGNVYVADWHDTGECHNYDKTHPSGRVYKIVYGTAKHEAVDLNALSDDGLVALLADENEWKARHARRLLQERAAKREVTSIARDELKRLAGRKQVNARLRALWATHAFSTRSQDDFIVALLREKSPVMRRWLVRLQFDSPRGPLPAGDAITLGQYAAAEEDAGVRLAWASALQKLAPADRWPVAKALAARAEDADDPYLPLMIWYGIEPAVPLDPGKAAELLSKARVPLVRRHVARRLAAMAE